jgi:cobalt-zinc-cadmium efflux system outer membrane protein
MMVAIFVRVLARRERFRFIAIGFITVLISPHLFALPQQQPPQPEGMQHQGGPTLLSLLIEEAKRNDPAIRVAESAAHAATFTAPQMSSRPDPQFTLQQFSVGSPRPFAGYTNSDFAYIGLGVSQRFPYPGKLKLRGEVADRDADTAKAHVQVVEQDEIEMLKTTYAHLAYLQQTLGILQQNAALLQ